MAMRLRIFAPRSVFGACGLAVIALPAAGQFVPGTWTGLLQLSGGHTVAIEFNVRDAGASPQITMNTIGGPVTPVTDVETSGDNAVFRWGGFACSLMKRDEATYAGQCATTDGTEGLLVLNAPQDREAPSDIVTNQDLVDTRASNVYEALQRIRPYWIRPRGRGRMLHAAVVAVYIESQPVGDVTVLRTIRIEDVDEVTFLNATDATTRFGTNNDGGAIVIARRRG